MPILIILAPILIAKDRFALPKSDQQIRVNEIYIIGNKKTKEKVILREMSLKYIGTCQNCGEKFFYRKRIKNIACKKCCVNFFNGSWNKDCLIVFD